MKIVDLITTVNTKLTQYCTQTQYNCSVLYAGNEKENEFPCILFFAYNSVVDTKTNLMNSPGSIVDSYVQIDTYVLNSTDLAKSNTVIESAMNELYGVLSGSRIDNIDGYIRASYTYHIKH